MKAKDMTAVAMMMAIVIVLGLVPPIPIGLIPVPIVFQNLGIMLAGITLGSRKGGLAVLLFLLLVVMGMPFLTGGSGGASVFVGPTAGYLLGWLVSTLLIGLGRQRFRESSNWLVKFVLIWVPGVLLSDFLGSIGLFMVTGMNFRAALLSNLAFIPGDTIKVLLVVMIADRLIKLPLFRN
ncbi:biotin transporter BioY [Vagococcus zengguangii]|uniref:Biotin transporter n=1 Tax=Vagococcus zengguangii TaxID=2571750 RepID=A0A4D7CSE5_9ENTE|nr:biotin transporter BioY [Vagococcus zengguangii]QCI87109.1 biotin transporter BioY [Vagococcus zengguangii]TLG78304.1 biotin transporter BioY [Vagococcus zengguangii]